MTTTSDARAGSSAGEGTSGDAGAAGQVAWRALVADMLRKRGRLGEDEQPDAPEDVLARDTLDGLRLAPLYMPGGVAADAPDDAPAGLPGRPPFVRGGELARDETGWQVRQRVTERDAAAANDTALAELENGATSLWLSVGGDRGVPVADLGRALDGVLLDLAQVTLEPADDAMAAAHALLGLAAGAADADLRLQLGLDPLGELARRGGAARPALAPSAAELADLIAELPAAPGVRALVADALPYHEAGCSDVEELALALATGVTYLRELAEAGVDPAVTAARLEFRYAATVDQFATIAKLRAARLLWDRATDELGLAAAVRGQLQHAVTSTVMMTRRDPWVNLLRTSVAAFAAGVGGADAVTVLPFDSALQQASGDGAATSVDPPPLVEGDALTSDRADVQGRRLARNTQSLLVMEAHLARVRDPAGGSAYVESRTAATAEAAWDVFRELESAGGLRAALQDGSVARRLAGTWERRRSQVAHRTSPVLGVSEYANLSEPPLPPRPRPDAQAGGDGGQDGAGASGLPVVRLAQDFERLRDRSDAALAADGARPSVPVVLLGSAGRHAARLGFVTTLLAAGGIEARTTTPEESAEVAAGSAVAVVAGADPDYAEHGADAVERLRAAGVAHVLVAGKAKALPSADAAVALGADAVALLTDLLDRLEVPR